jgi:hypothetical protein
MDLGNGRYCQYSEIVRRSNSHSLRRGNLDQCLLMAHIGHAFANHFVLDTKRYQTTSREI